jgi:hypothetical protein
MPRLSPTGAPLPFPLHLNRLKTRKPTAQYRAAVMAVCASAAQFFIALKIEFLSDRAN